MTEKWMKQQLRRMLDTYTPGAILHFLGDVYRDLAEEARRDNDVKAQEKYELIESAVIVVGMGVDAACPRE